MKELPEDIMGISQNIKNLPKNIKDVIEVYKSLKELSDEKDYYEELDWLEEPEQLDRLYEYRNRLFSLLKKTQSLQIPRSWFEPVKSSVVNLVMKLLSWTEKSLVLLIGYPDIPSEEDYKEMCMKYVVENAFLFYKLRVPDDYSWFEDRWRWVVDNVTKKHIDADRENDHTRFLSGNDYKISLEDVEYLIWKYVNEDVKKCLQEKCYRFTSDKKELESRKKSIVSELKEKYPNATWNCKTFLLSARNWDVLCKDFLKEEKQSILNRIKESKVLESYNHSINFIVVISVFLNSYLNSWNLDKKFEDYILMRTENGFMQAEEKKKAELSKQKTTKWNNNIQPIVEVKSIPQKRDLPIWMEEEIKKLDIIDDRQLIRFFKVELTNFGWYIKMSHLKDRLSRMSEIDSLPDALALLDNYPEFIIEDDEKNIEEEKKLQNLNTDNLEIIENISTRDLLSNKLLEITNKSDIDERLSWYISIFEELWFKFKDKENFFHQLKDAVDRTERYCLEKSIQIALKFRIFGYWSLSKKWWWFWYHAICLNYKSWRIVLTNMKITHILPHDEYEKLINTKPS